MTPGLYGDIAAIAGLLLLSAFFSGSETALTAVSRPLVHGRAERGDRAALRVKRLLDRREQMISAILFGNNLVNILASALATRLLVSSFGGAGVLYATAVMTTLILVFAEVLPKTFAIRHADRAAPVVAVPIAPLVAALTPLTVVVAWLFRAVGRIGGPAPRPAEVTEELRGAIELAATAGVGKGRRDMLRSVLDLDRVTVGEVMVHRSAMTTIAADAPLAAAAALAAASPYSRFPVWSGERENIVGVLHAKALLAAFREGARPGPIEGFCDPPWFVPETATLARQLEAFRTRRQRLALVVDEYGELEGLITLEDVLEEIVGAIADESDRPAAAPALEADGSAVVPGSATIRDVNRRFDWSLPDDDAATVAGLAIEAAARLPDVGESAEIADYRLTVVARTRAHLTRVRIAKIET